MKDKYYTPSIEEFHVGFEYEYDGKCVFRIGMSISFMDYLISNGKIRVKYLDQEDIESLGFDLDSTVEQESFYVKGNFMKGDEYRLIYRDEERTTEIHSTNDNNPNSFFGIIKNKSELKKILKQIGV